MTPKQTTELLDIFVRASKRITPGMRGNPKLWIQAFFPEIKAIVKIVKKLKKTSLYRKTIERRREYLVGVMTGFKTKEPATIAKIVFVDLLDKSERAESPELLMGAYTLLLPIFSDYLLEAARKSQEGFKAWLRRIWARFQSDRVRKYINDAQ